MARKVHASSLSESLDRHFARLTTRRARRGLPAPQALVRAPDFEYSSGERTQRFHAASVGKLATATLIMQEIEAGKLTLDSTVESLLPEPELRGLFSRAGATLEELLAHTSGAPDYFEGKATAGPKFIDLVTQEPARRWEPEDLLNYSRSRQTPLAEPGSKFAYSDTGYVLLGRILEEHTGQSFTELLRKRVFAPAEMDHSVFWLREPCTSSIAPAWLGRTEVSGFNSITCDWAGGGIVTALDDLASFTSALTDGTLLRQDTWESMATARHRFRPGIHYGLGVMQLRFEGFMPLLRGLPRPVGHIGVLGVHAFTDPSTLTTVVLNFHGTREMVASFQSHIRIQQGLSSLRANDSR